MNDSGPTVSADHARGLKILQRALETGKAKAAVQAFQELAGQSLAPGELGGELARMLRGLYEEFRVSALFGFIAWLKKFPEREIVEPAIAIFEPILRDVQEWNKTLEQLSGERLARELRVLVRSRDVDGAAAKARLILDGASTDAQKLHLARRVGAILGSLGQDRPRTTKVIAKLGRRLGGIGLNASQFAALQETHDQTHTNLALSQMSEHERQWNLIHTDAVVELMRKLPGRGAVETKPGPEEEQRFLDGLQALAASYFHLESDLEKAEARARFLDVVRILREFCPADPRAAGPVEGVEDAAFLRMTAMDKLVSVRVLRRLGQKKRLVDRVLRAAHQVTEGRAAASVLAVMGGLSNVAFYSHLAGALKEKKHRRAHETIVDALGRIGDRQCLGTLRSLLVRLSSVSVVDPPARRRISNCLAALGRIARHPDTTPEERNATVLKVFKTLPKDRSLQGVALQHFCTWNPAGLSPQIQRMAVDYAVDNLWTLDSSVKLGPGDPDQQETELGFRDRTVNILIAMGSGSLPYLLESAEKRSLQYSGAYMAMGEVLAKIGDKSSLPFLERILTMTLRTDESSIVAHRRETYFDAAKNEHVMISRDKIAHSVVYAIHKACGAEGMATLGSFAGRIRGNEFESPGEVTMGFLAKVLVEARMASRSQTSLSAAPPDSGDSPTPSLDDEMSGASAFAGSPATRGAGGPALETPKRPREGDSLKNLLKEIQGKGIFGTKREKRISAIQEVGARREQEAIPVLCSRLGSDDKILSAAAETALSEIVHPRDTQPVFRRALYALLECLRDARGKRVQAITQLVDRMRPERDPAKSLLVRFLEVEPQAKMKKNVAEIFSLANARLARSGESVDLSSVTRDGSAPPEAGDVSKSAAKMPDVAALKREYFNTRRAWIEGGKKGPEPPRPKGI